MNLEIRKQKFKKLLEDLLEEQEGVKVRLAEKLQVSPSRLTHWFQRQIDPAGLDIGIFKQVADAKGCSIDRLAQILDFAETEEKSPAKFRRFLQELLSNRTQEELANSIGVNQGTISRWLNPDSKIDLTKIPAKTMFCLAREKEWTLDKLFDYLKLESNSKINNNGVFDNSLSVKPQIQLSNRRICIILDKEDIAIASRYSSNLVLHVKLNPNNIEVVTISTLPDPLESFDLLIFDIESKCLSTIELIQHLSFDGNIIICASVDLSDKVRSSLESKLTEVLIKPIDWSELKDKPYFIN